MFVVLERTYDDQHCSIARSLEVVGERWTLLILRDVLRGTRRFDDLQQSLGITRSVLSTRLSRLVDEGVLERRRYQDRPERFDYIPTKKGLDLWPVIVALLQWGDRYYAAPGGPPVVLEHKGCGGSIDERRVCTRCGQALDVRDAVALPGPGAPARA
jgi:DNA-binding HxlR family transcriptional regulator